MQSTRENLAVYAIPEWTEAKKEIVLKNNGKTIFDETNKSIINDCEYVFIEIPSKVLLKDIRDALGIDRRLLTFNGYLKDRLSALKDDKAITVEKTEITNKYLVTFPASKLKKVNMVTNKWQEMIKYLSSDSHTVQIHKNICRTLMHDTGEFGDNIIMPPNAYDIDFILQHVKHSDALAVDLRIHPQDFCDGYIDDVSRLLKEIELNTNIQSLHAAFMHYLSLNQFKLLITPAIIKKIIYSLSFNGANFLELNLDFTFSEDIIDYMLCERSFRMVLDECTPGRQIASKTCAAHSIMKYLYENKLIAEFSMTKEMEIYKLICSEFGGLADSGKIKDYLQSFDIDVTLVVDKQIVKPITDTIPIAKEKYIYTKSIFDKDHYKKSGINEQTFPQQTAMLIVVNDGDHMLIANRSLDGEIILNNPASHLFRRFSGIDSLNDTKSEEMEASSTYPTLKKFSGIAFGLFHKNRQATVKPGEVSNQTKRSCINK